MNLLYNTSGLLRQKSLYIIGLIGFGGLLFYTIPSYYYSQFGESQSPVELDERNLSEIWDFSIETDGVNLFYDTLLLTPLQPNPYSNLNRVFKQEVINENLYMMTEEMPGQVFKYGTDGTFKGVIGSTNSQGMSRNFTFDICPESGNIIIANTLNSTIKIYSPKGELLRKKEPDFFFIDFKYFSSTSNFLFLIIQPDPGFSISQHHKLYLADSNITIIDSLFPFTPNQLHKELGVSRSLKQNPNKANKVFFADMLLGEIYEIDDNGNKTLAYKVEDGIENRADSLSALNPNNLNNQDVNNNLKFYSIFDYHPGSNLLAVAKTSLEGPRKNLIFSKDHGTGLKFARGIRSTGPFLEGHPFMFHFGIIDFMKDDTIGTIISPDLWSFMKPTLTDPSIVLDHTIHLPDSIEYPILKMAVLKESFFDEEALSYSRLIDKSESSNNDSGQKSDYFLYPNPTTGFVQVGTHSSQNKEDLRNMTVKIFNINGELLGEFPAESKIDLRQLAIRTGTYLFSLENELGEQITSRPFLYHY